MAGAKERKMSSSRTKGLAALAPLLFFAVAACEFVTDNEFATLTLQLTDAADEEVTQAWVTITDAYLQPGSDGSGSEGPRVYVLEDAEEVHELVRLANDVAFLAVGVEIPADTYEQLRLVISDGCIVVKSGGETTVYSSSANYLECGPRDGTLQMPSFGQSGLKIELDGLELSGDRGILLDFDVSESYGHQAGNSGRWVMHPVVHWMEADLTARIDVSLSAGDPPVPLPGDFGLEDFTVTISPTSAPGETVPFVDDGEGNFVVSFRPLNPAAGPFDLELNAPPPLVAHLSAAYDDSPTNVSPGSGEVASVEWVLESIDVGGGT
jgi:hypothetical protein